MLTWILGYFWSLPRGVSPRLEWGHARALVSRAVAAMSDFYSRGSRHLWLSLEAFPQGCPTCHRGVSRSSARKSRQCRETGFPGMHLDIWGSLRMVARPWSSSRLSCVEGLLLNCDGNAGNSFQKTRGRDPTSGAKRQKWGSSGCGRDSRDSSRVETGMSGNFLSCRKGVKDPLEVPEVRCD